MSFTYTQLKSAIQDYAENDETSFVTNLPVFIRAAEERILKMVQLSLFRKNASGNMTASNQFLTVPTDFLAPYSLSFTNSSSEKTFLEFKDVNFIQTFNPNPATTGDPRFYALFDVTNFIIGPTPSASSDVEVHYFYRPTSLTAGADSGTTWLSENATISLLYGSLIEAYTYMKGEQDLITNYQQRFMEGIASHKKRSVTRET